MEWNFLRVISEMLKRKCDQMRTAADLIESTSASIALKLILKSKHHAGKNREYLLW